MKENNQVLTIALFEKAIAITAIRNHPMENSDKFLGNQGNRQKLQYLNLIKFYLKSNLCHIDDRLPVIYHRLDQ